MHDDERERLEVAQPSQGTSDLPDPGGGDEPRTRWPRWKRLTIGVLAGCAALVLTCTGYQVITWPDVEALDGQRPETTAFIERYKARERDTGRTPQLRWEWVPYDRISPHLKRAVVVGEDIEFFSHEGFSISELKAVLDDFVSEGRLRGASTITQQLAKNLWLTPSRNPFRKAKEALLTRQLEEHLSKRRILELYLNVVEFGPGVYGAEAAARHYFGKSAEALTEREAAQLAAALPRPATWHPGVDSDRYWWYVNEILGRMESADFLWRRIGAEVRLPPPEVDTLPLDTAGGAVFDTLRAITPDSALRDTTAVDTAAVDTVPGGG